MSALHFLTLGENVAEFAVSLQRCGHQVEYEKLREALLAFARAAEPMIGQPVQTGYLAGRARLGFERRCAEAGVNLPEEHDAQIVESAVRPVDGGKALFVIFEVLSGVREGLKLSVPIDLVNEDQAIQAVGLYQLAQLFDVTGTPPSRDSEDLHFRPLRIKVRPNGQICGLRPIRGRA